MGEGATEGEGEGEGEGSKSDAPVGRSVVNEPRTLVCGNQCSPAKARVLFTVKREKSVLRAGSRAS